MDDSIPDNTLSTDKIQSNEVIEVSALKLAQVERVDKFLQTKTKLSRSALQRLFEQEKILVNGNICKKNYKVKSGDQFKLFVLVDAQPKDIQPIDHPLEIIYEDEYLLVINKEPGMAVHPGQGEESTSKITLVNVLLHRYGRSGLSEGEGVDRPGIVHRLDKDTSGLMIVCKTNECHQALKSAFQNRTETLKKQYNCVVLGKMGQNEGSIETPIMRHPGSRQGHKMTIAQAGDEKGKPASTDYVVLNSWQVQKQTYSLLRVQIHTGRTHQIRVHMSSISHPIVGDVLYSTKHNNHNVPYLLLVSKELEFQHPITKKMLNFSIDLPKHMQQFIEKIEKQQASFEKSTSQNANKKKVLNDPYKRDDQDLQI